MFIPLTSTQATLLQHTDSLPQPQNSQSALRWRGLYGGPTETNQGKKNNKKTSFSIIALLVWNLKIEMPPFKLELSK